MISEENRIYWKQKMESVSCIRISRMVLWKPASLTSSFVGKCDSAKNGWFVPVGELLDF